MLLSSLGWQIDCNYSSEQTCWYVENFLLFFWLFSLSLWAKKLFLKCAGSQLSWKVSFDRSCHSPKLPQVPTAAIYTSLVSSYNSLAVRNMWMWNSKHWNQFIYIYIHIYIYKETKWSCERKIVIFFHLQLKIYDNSW